MKASIAEGKMKIAPYVHSTFFDRDYVNEFAYRQYRLNFRALGK